MAEETDYADLVKHMADGIVNKRKLNSEAMRERLAKFEREALAAMGVCYKAMMQAHQAGLLMGSRMSAQATEDEKQIPRLLEGPSFYLYGSDKISLMVTNDLREVYIKKDFSVEGRGSPENALPTLLEYMAKSALIKREKDARSSS